MMVTYTTEGGVFRADKPRPWTNVQLATRFTGVRAYALHPDGNRVVGSPVPARDPMDIKDSVIFVFNFFEELRRLTPSKN